MNDKVVLLKVSGMSDDHCAEAVVRAINMVEGVTSAEASVVKGEAVVSFDADKATAENFIGAIDLAGYGATIS